MANSGLMCFFEVLSPRREPELSSDGQWTDFLGEILEEVAERMDCYVARRRPHPDDDQYSGEYLNIDSLFIPFEAYESLEADSGSWDPFVLPKAAVELENSFVQRKIAYCLWKIACLRVPIRVLICYQPNRQAIQDLIGYLEDVVRRGVLMRDDHGNLMVLIGDESCPNEASWEEYYAIYEWRDGALLQCELETD